MGERTQARHETSADAEASTRWNAGDAISVTRLPGTGHPMARAMGVGVLLDRLAVGCEVRIRLDEGLALAPSRVRSLETAGEDAVVVGTLNHHYEILRIDGVPSGAGRLSIHDETTRGRDGFETGVIRIDDWPAPDTAAFTEGARVHVAREDDDGRRELGPGILLTEITPGEPFSLALDETVVSTSAVTGVRDVSSTEIDVATARSRYTLRLEPVKEGAE